MTGYVILYVGSPIRDETNSRTHLVDRCSLFICLCMFASPSLVPSLVPSFVWPLQCGVVRLCAFVSLQLSPIHLSAVFAHLLSKPLRCAHLQIHPSFCRFGCCSMPSVFVCLPPFYCHPCITLHILTIQTDACVSACPINVCFTSSCE